MSIRNKEEKEERSELDILRMFLVSLSKSVDLMNMEQNDMKKVDKELEKTTIIMSKNISIQKKEGLTIQEKTKMTTREDNRLIMNKNKVKREEKGYIRIAWIGMSSIPFLKKYHQWVEYPRIMTQGRMLEQ